MTLITAKTASIVRRLLDNLALGVTSGLSKKQNEDRLGYTVGEDELRICIADGHWGEDAAERIVKYWLAQKLTGLSSRQIAVTQTQAIENELYRSFGKEKMNPDKDFTPEASFVTARIKADTLTAIGYGDCRLIVVRNRKAILELKTQETWLGAFSRLGLRGRSSVAEALVFRKQKLQKGDYVIMFTDGVDQCVYEVPTISISELAKATRLVEPLAILDHVFKQVFAKGAEDNASLVIYIHA